MVIQIDLADSAQTEFWRGHNPGALAMVEGSGMKSEDPATAFICQVGGWVGGWVLRAARQPSSVASCQQCTTSQMAMPPLLPAFGLATLLQNFTCKAPAKDPARVRAALAEPRSSGPTPTPVAFKFPPPAGSGR